MIIKKEAASRLTQDEVWKIINAPDNIKHRLFLMTTYSAGLRSGEVTNLKPDNIDSKRMLIKVTGKGGKERYSLLSKMLLEELRRYYKAVKPTIWLFPSCYTKKGIRPITYQSAYNIYQKARKAPQTQTGDRRYSSAAYSSIPAGAFFVGIRARQGRVCSSPGTGNTDGTGDRMSAS